MPSNRRNFIRNAEQQINLVSNPLLKNQEVVKNYRSSLPISPVFHINDKNVIPLGKYDHSGKVAFGCTKDKNHQSFYSVLGGMPASILREVARTAGVHIYYEGTNTVHINNRLIGVHFQHENNVEIKLPFKNQCKLTELYDGGEVTANNGQCTLPLDPGVAKLYFLVDGENTVIKT
ncbi:hypothetical protein ACX0G7_21295 [Flavitalea antarctica]